MRFRKLTLAAAVLAILLAPGPRLLAQGGDPTLVLQDHEVRVRALEAKNRDYEEAMQRYAREIASLQAEIRSLRTALRDSQDSNAKSGLNLATRDDLKALAAKIEEIDKLRLQDDRKIISKIEELSRLPAPAPTPLPDRTPDKTDKASNPPITGEFAPHKVEEGQTLSAILSAYNKEFKSMGKKSVTLEMVQKANPKLKVDRISPGQTILIPVPPDAK